MSSCHKQKSMKTMMLVVEKLPLAGKGKMWVSAVIARLLLFSTYITDFINAQFFVFVTHYIPSVFLWLCCVYIKQLFCVKVLIAFEERIVANMVFSLFRLHQLTPKTRFLQANKLENYRPRQFAKIRIGNCPSLRMCKSEWSTYLTLGQKTK